MDAEIGTVGMATKQWVSSSNGIEHTKASAPRTQNSKRAVGVAFCSTPFARPSQGASLSHADEPCSEPAMGVLKRTARAVTYISPAHPPPTRGRHHPCAPRAACPFVSQRPPHVLSAHSQKRAYVSHGKRSEEPDGVVRIPGRTPSHSRVPYLDAPGQATTTHDIFSCPHLRHQRMLSGGM